VGGKGGDGISAGQQQLRLPRRRLLAGLSAAAGAGLLLGFQRLRAAGGQRPATVNAGSKSGTSPTAPVSKASAAPAPVDMRPPVRGAGALTVLNENALPGSMAWRLVNPAGASEIQAYAGQDSVNAGDSIDFFVSTRTPGVAYRADFYRMGWYGGAGARLMASAGNLVGQSQGYYDGKQLIGSREARLDALTGFLDVNWQRSYRLAVPVDWLSGVYLAVLTEAHGKQTYVPFVVRQDDRTADLLFKASFNTYQAYNAWGGKSLYSDNSLGANTVGGGPGAVKVSFNRPYDADFGSGHFLRYEYNLVRWLERMGYDVAYVADSDIAARPWQLQQHRGFISPGHDEYWTDEQRTGVEVARDAGVHLAFLSGNSVYWQARYEASAAGDPHRTLVVYRDTSDPICAKDAGRATILWRDPPVDRPQNLLTGTIYAGMADPFTQDWVPQDTSSWLFYGSGLRPGDRIKGLVGKEFDGAPADLAGPPGLKILSHSPIKVPDTDLRHWTVYADSTLYQATSGATVVSAGTVTWSWGLDDQSFPLGTSLHNTPVSPAIQRMTQNLFDRFVYGPGDHR
jgi:hypothetical protein